MYLRSVFGQEVKKVGHVLILAEMSRLCGSKEGEECLCDTASGVEGMGV